MCTCARRVAGATHSDRLRCAFRRHDIEGNHMASICKQVELDADAAAVWDALRDFGAVHARVAPGFVVATQLDGDSRVVTFGNGATARERLISSNDAERR